ncbi:MAG: fumarylacetoacetate hydrolase family protein [Pseudomonadota bacterium]
MKYIFDPTIASLFINGDEARFPVRRIFCVGRNYAAHAREMGGDDREPPFFFMKPLTALLPIQDSNPVELPIPPGTQNYHHEVELVVALHKGGANIYAGAALQHVFGMAIGLDMTRRDLQKQMSSQQKPWDFGKAADFSAPVGPLHKISGDMREGAISLSVDGEIRQNGNLSDMIWSIAEQIAHLSQYFTLQPGDIIFTGTPEGVGPVTAGQKISAKIEGIGEINLTLSQS